jgi:MHS family citrate/tricarballylate:H+ symporter-like MFS transporter
MLTFATFGAGFFMRPLGALVLGAYVDRVGRRQGLVVTLGIMALGTVLIAITPSYQTIHNHVPALALAAPALVLLGRLAQGFSAGVEVGSVSVYLAEMAPPGQRGFYASWQSASQQVAIIVAAALGFALSSLLTPEQIQDFGWRIPFFVGCLIVPVLFVLRSSLPETEVFLARKHHPDARAILASLVTNWQLVVLGSMLVMMTTVSFYLITVYTPTFGNSVLEVTAAESLAVTFCAGISNFIWLPVMGALSDRTGRKPLLVAFTVLPLLTAYPVLVWLAGAPTFGKMLAALLWLSFIYGGFNGAMVAALTEIMPTDVRTTGFSFAYSVATALFGGSSLTISTGLIELLHDKAAPGLWMTAAAAVSLGATLILYRSRRPARGTTGRCTGLKRPSEFRGRIPAEDCISSFLRLPAAKPARACRRMLCRAPPGHHIAGGDCPFSRCRIIPMPLPLPMSSVRSRAFRRWFLQARRAS